MENSTVKLLQALSDCVQFDGYTQEISMLIRHKINPADRIHILMDIEQILSEPTK